MHKPESVLENVTQNSLGFCDTNGSPNPDQMTRPCVNDMKIKRVVQ